MAEEYGSGLLVHCSVGVQRGFGGGDHECRHQLRIEERAGGVPFTVGEDPLGYFVDREVFANVPLRRFPQEGAFGRAEFDQQGPVALGEPAGGLIGDRFV